jgi:hypothetical protein
MIETQHRRAEDAKRTALERFEAIFQNTRRTWPSRATTPAAP